MSKSLYDISNKPPAAEEIEAHGKVLSSAATKMLIGLIVSIVIFLLTITAIINMFPLIIVALLSCLWFGFAYTSKNEDLVSHREGSQNIDGRDCEDALTYSSAPAVKRYLDDLASVNRQLNYSELAMLRAAYLQHEDSSRKQALYGGVRP